ncbi:MAG: NYN domain-containing protein [Candidatus Acidiferrales bacterium]
MADETYLFIDGAYLRDKHSKALRRVFTQVPEISLLQLKGQAIAKRVFFYDCLHDIKDEVETEEAFQERLKKDEAYFSAIRALPGFHVRWGTLTGRRGRLRQKEVDVQLAVDMLTHGFSKNMSKAVLLSGDLDFRPIVEALIRAGVFVEIWYEKESAAKELFWAADYGRELTFQDFYSMSDEKFTQENPLPRKVVGREPELMLARPLKSGQANGRPVHVFKTGLLYRLLYSAGWHDSIVLELDKQDTLERYFSEFYAPIEWDK